MRDNAEFKAFVYEKADVERIKVKKKKALIARSVTALSVCFVIVSVIAMGSGGFINKGFDSAKESGYGLKAANNMYYSAYDSDGAMEVGVAEIQCEDITSGTHFSYLGDKADFVEADDNGAFNESYSFSNADFLEIAKKECRIEYESYDVFYDNAEEVWKIVFYNTDKNGTNQSVYVGKDGSLKMIIFE